jgi:16S rRNA (uracil1498-N3)-methyltransferase
MRHWRGVVIAACEQCGRATLPSLEAPVDLFQWLGRPGDSLRLVLDPTVDRKLSGLALKERDISVLVGPEGGLTDPEFVQLEQAGVLAVRMGPRVLRTETAGPAAIAVLQALAGDF